MADLDGDEPLVAGAVAALCSSAKMAADDGG